MLGSPVGSYLLCLLLLSAPVPVFSDLFNLRKSAANSLFAQTRLSFLPPRALLPDS